MLNFSYHTNIFIGLLNIAVMSLLLLMMFDDDFFKTNNSTRIGVYFFGVFMLGITGTLLLVSADRIKKKIKYDSERESFFR